MNKSALQRLVCSPDQLQNRNCVNWPITGRDIKEIKQQTKFWSRRRQDMRESKHE